MKIPRHLLLALAATVFTLLSFGFGAFVADPLPVVRRVQELRLHSMPARVEFFSGHGGTRLRTWAVGPESSSVPVVLLHGLGASGDYWTGTAKALTKAGRLVYLPDAPGSGGSTRPGRATGYGMEARVAALVSLVQAMGFSKIDLVGHSLGGWTAARFALEHPEAIRKLVLVDAGGLSPVPPAEMQREMYESLSPRSREGGRALVDRLFEKKPFPVTGFVSDAFARNYRNENVTRTLLSLRPSDWVIDEAHRLPHGTVVIWGEKETLFPLEEVRPAIARIPGVKLLVIKGVGHDGPLEAPEVFNETLVAALGAEDVK